VFGLNRATTSPQVMCSPGRSSWRLARCLSRKEAGQETSVQNSRVCGVVVNWGPTVRLGLHVDPITIKASFVVDGTGHPAKVVLLLAKRGFVEMKTEFPIDADEAEKFVVKNTGEGFPGLLVSGMAACAVHGGPRGWDRSSGVWFCPARR